MPKIKTRRGAAKRFKLTSKGKVKKNRATKAHLLTKMDAFPLLNHLSYMTLGMSVLLQLTKNRRVFYRKWAMQMLINIT